MASQVQPGIHNVAHDDEKLAGQQSSQSLRINTPFLEMQCGRMSVSRQLAKSNKGCTGPRQPDILITQLTFTS